jgi:hypothetical protein
MKSKVGILLLALVASWFSSCAHINGVMRSWEGHHYGELIGNCGPPFLLATLKGSPYTALHGPSPRLP